MDDVAFFDSSSYSYRGGIWPDAARREKSDVSNVSNEPSTVDDDVSIVSAPPDADSSSLSPGDADSNVKRSNSEGNVSVGPDPQRSSPQPSYHRPGLPPSRGPSPTPDPPSYQSNQQEHDTPVEEPDLQTEAALLEVQHPPLRHKSSISSEKSKRRFLSIRRTSQQTSLSRSSSREPSPTPSLERVASPEPLNGVSPHSETRPKSPAPSGQSSLFSTLKSRAGDRQALGNTARETVRKWAVNWAGLKKDRDSSVASSEDAQDHRPHSASQKVKSSYAEIRAAVDERREKERRSSDVAPTPAPILIPDRRRDERADSVSSAHNPQSSSLSSSQADSPVASSAGWSTGTGVDETSHDSSSTRPPTIDVDGMQLDSPDVDKAGPSAITIIVPPSPMDLPRPIQSQPSQGKTMTIPGIHARNRGEVMSMGYVPPSPPAPETKPGVSSVYRLWKHSPTQSEHAEDSIDRAGSQSPPMLSADSAETSPEPSPTPTNNVRLQAPPLPPRALPSVHLVPSESSSVSPASAALKSIVSRDEEFRVQDGEDVEASSPHPPVGPKPPLPPRKIPTSA